MFHEIIDSVELVNYNLKMIDNYNDEDDFTSDRKDKHEYYEYQDSIDDDDGDNIKTVPTPIKHKLYEMTFKKEPNQHNHFEIVNDNKDNRILFGLEEQKQAKEILSQPLVSFYRSSFEELINIPFGTLSMIQLNESQQCKLEFVSQLLELRRVSIKAKHADLNYKCLQQKDDKTEQQKHKVFLLSLLAVQLKKKLFIESLKMNMLEAREEKIRIKIQQSRSKAQLNAKILRDKQRAMQQVHNSPNKQSLSKNKEIRNIQRSPLGSPFRSNLNNQSGSKDKSRSQQKPARDIIFQQILVSIIKKKLYRFYTDFLDKCHEYILQQQNNQLYEHQIDEQTHNSQESIIHSQSMRSSFFEEGSLLPRYHNNGEQSDNQIAKYFKRQSQERSDHFEMSSMSDYPHHENNLKREKSQLKSYLISNRCYLALNNLKNHYSMRLIKNICRKLSAQNLLKRSFIQWKRQWHASKTSAELAQYYQDIADNQIQQGLQVAKLFYHTNLICNYFHKVKEQHRNNKCERILLKVTLRMGFTRIRMYVQMSRHHEQLASRLLIVRNRKIIFRCFRGWKSECGSLSSISKVRAYTNTRNQQIVDECFSMMKLFYKQLLLKKRQAENYHTQTVFARYFPLWRRQTEVEMEFKMVELSAKQFIGRKKKHQFFKRLTLQYKQILHSKRCQVREDKVRKSRLMKSAWERLRQWRNRHLRTHTYSAITNRLLKLKALEDKRKLFSKWYQEMTKKKRLNQLDSSSGHKNWLISYYDNLCEIMKH